MKGSISQIGPYRIEEKLGSGGMATVYRGVREGIGAFERAVAVKVLHAELVGDAEHVEMFQAEARLASRLAHPVLVPVTDLGEAEGIHYMAMDLLTGETLADLRDAFAARKQSMPIGHALWIISQVLDGLHYAHELVGEDGTPAGVVHRDVSPRNIFVTRSGQVRLVDFGIARSTIRQQHTQAGIVKGTVPYMAPEQALAQPLDRRADVFAVGVILHELLTGEIPLKATRTDAQRQALARMELKPHLKKIHLGIRDVVTRALAGKADDRFATAEEMAKAIRAAMEKLAPEHDPRLLGGLAGRTARVKAKEKSGPAKGKRLKRARKKRGDQAGTDIGGSDIGGSDIRVSDSGSDVDAPRWRDRLGLSDGIGPIDIDAVEPYPAGPTLALVATLILMLGLVYTFVTGIA
jgi:serine/threonine protein kinase